MSFSDPTSIIAQCAFGAHVDVADFGAGSGAYSIAVAQRLSHGTVYAIEIQEGLARRLGERAKKEHIDNLKVLWGDIETDGGSTLGNAAVDVVILANTLFQATHKNAVVREAFRILKPGGMLLFVDWADSFGGLGPRAGDVINEHDGRVLLETAGFLFDRAISAGDHHYGFCMKKPSA